MRSDSEVVSSNSDLPLVCVGACVVLPVRVMRRGLIIACVAS